MSGALLTAFQDMDDFKTLEDKNMNNRMTLATMIVALTLGALAGQEEPGRK